MVGSSALAENGVWGNGADLWSRCGTGTEISTPGDRFTATDFLQRVGDIVSVPAPVQLLDVATGWGREVALMKGAAM